MAALYTRKANRRRLAGDARHHVVPSEIGNETVPFSGPVEKGGIKAAKNTRKNNVV
jgi:hypothetical protein